MQYSVSDTFQKVAPPWGSGALSLTDGLPLSQTQTLDYYSNDFKFNFTAYGTIGFAAGLPLRFNTKGGWATDIDTGVDTYVNDPEFVLTSGYLFAGSTIFTSTLPVLPAPVPPPPAPVRVEFFIPFRATVDPVWNGFRLTIELFEVEPRFPPFLAPPAPATLPGPIPNGLNSIGTHRFTVQPYRVNKIAWEE